MKSVSSSIGFQKKQERLENFVYIPSQIDLQDQSQWAGEREMVDCTVINARTVNTEFNFHKHGFQLEILNSKHNPTTPEGLEEYGEKLKEYLSNLTKCNQIEIFDYTIRSSSYEERSSQKKREPSAMMHGDFTERSGFGRLEYHFQKKGEPIPKYERFFVLNVWKSLKGTILRDPLVLIDSQTIEKKDLYPIERRANNRNGEIFQVSFDKNQKLYFFPEMTENEMLVFKTFDSNPGKDECSFCIHSSFENFSQSNPPPRNSIEARLFLFFN